MQQSTSPAMPARRPLARLPISSEALMTLVLFAVLIVVVVAVGGGAGIEEQLLPYRLDDAGEEGLLALRLWLGEMDYQVDIMEGSFHLPYSADLLFVYPNRTMYSQTDVSALQTWVRQGHTLVLVGPDPADTELIDAFGVRSRRLPELEPERTLRQQQPLLPDAPASLGELGFGPALDLDDAPAAVPVIATDEGQVTMAVQPYGRGTVWHLSTRHALTNGALSEDTAEGVIVPALLREVPDGGRIVFDTYHLYGAEAMPQNRQSLRGWLYSTPTGWALLFAGLSLGVYLLLQGRRLGPPLPAQSDARRREAAEYVNAMAALQRRARQRHSVAGYHKQRLKRTLGRRWHVSPALGDEEFVRRLEQADDSLSRERADTIRDLLAGLDSDPDEAQLVAFVNRVDTLCETT